MQISWAWSEWKWHGVTLSTDRRCTKSSENELLWKYASSPALSMYLYLLYSWSIFPILAMRQRFTGAIHLRPTPRLPSAMWGYEIGGQGPGSYTTARKCYWGQEKRSTLKYFKMASCWHKKEMERDRQSKEKEGSRETGRDNTLCGTIGYSSVSPIEPFISTTRQYIKHSQEEIKIGDLWRPEHHMILPITLKLHYYKHDSKGTYCSTTSGLQLPAEL